MFLIIFEFGKNKVHYQQRLDKPKNGLSSMTIEEITRTNISFEKTKMNKDQFQLYIRYDKLKMREITTFEINFSSLRAQIIGKTLIIFNKLQTFEYDKKKNEHEE